MGVASGMPCDADLLRLLPQWMAPGSIWQATLIGRSEIWPVHQATADLGGMLRDTATPERTRHESAERRARIT